MKESNKESFKGKKIVFGLFMIILSISLGYGLYLIMQPYTQGEDKTELTMRFNNGKNEDTNSNTKTNTENTNKIEADKSTVENSINGNTSDKTVMNEGNNKERGSIEEHSQSNTAKDNSSDYAKNSSDINSKNEEYDSLKNGNTNILEAEKITRIPTKVKGIYVTGPKAGSGKYMEDLINLVDTTELNTMVIDIKNDSGEITYNMDLPMAAEIGANKKYIHNIEELIKNLKEKNIYLIARVVAFKDPILAENKPELSIKNQDGSIFRDKSGLAWVNPYKKEVWEYLMEISKKAADLGFDEVQFDYIRFSTDSRMKKASFGKEAEGKTKLEIITEFTKYASEVLKPLGVYISADVYGAIIDSATDAKIVGQSYVDMAKYLDYISPMIYPSHYADGSYGILHPDLEPYNLIQKSMESSKTVLNEIPAGENKAIVRPWLQDFTASWIEHYKRYEGKEIRDQIKAVYDTGYEEWILWNGSNNYTKSGLELVK